MNISPVGADNRKGPSESDSQVNNDAKLADTVRRNPGRSSRNPRTFRIFTIILGILASSLVSAAPVMADTSWTSVTPVSSGPTDWSAITSSSDGTHLAAIGGGSIWTSVNSGESWTLRSGMYSSAFGQASDGTYYELRGAVPGAPESIASSSDGSHLLACGGFNLWTSADYGATWTYGYFGVTLASATDVSKQNINYMCGGLTSSSDGTHLAAGSRAGRGLLLSADSGANWKYYAPNFCGNVQHMATSSDGSHLIATCDGVRLWTSSDYGASWTDHTKALGQRSWTGIASSSDGTHLVGVASHRENSSGAIKDGIWISSDSGATWKPTATADQFWTGIASSSDGTHLAATIYGGDIYTSSDSGATWTAAGNVQNWQGIASSSDGTHLVGVVSGGGIWIGVKNDALNASSDTNTLAKSRGTLISQSLAFLSPSALNNSLTVIARGIAISRITVNLGPHYKSLPIIIQLQTSVGGPYMTITPPKVSLNSAGKLILFNYLPSEFTLRVLTGKKILITKSYP